MKNCRDFLGNILKKGDWIIKAERKGSSQNLVISKIEEEPIKVVDIYKREIFKFYIRSYSTHYNKFGKLGKAERTDLMIKIEESQVPLDILKNYEKV